MLALPTLLAVLALGLAADPDLSAAEKAFEEGRYEAVLPAVHRALGKPLAPAQTRRALELEAIADAAFDDSVAAIEAFRKLLAVDPAYQPGPTASPKVLGLLEEARRRGALGAKLEPVSKPAPVSAPLAATSTPAAPATSAVEPPLTHRWWFWTGVGVLVVGAGAGTWALARPQVPAGNLGTGQLR